VYNRINKWGEAMQKRIFVNSNAEDDLNNNQTFTIGVYLVLSFVSLVMTVLNVFTHKGYLTLCTGVFSVLCIINVILTLAGHKAKTVAKDLFAVEVILMFTFFLVSGNPDGFSSIWICMLPPVSMYFFNRTRGSVMCFVMLLILIFLLWTHLGKAVLQYDYTDTFKMRFPILFVAFFSLAFFLESRREMAYVEMRRLQDYYKDLSAKDSLTSLLNRQGMYSEISSKQEYKTFDKLYAVMFDIDDFKAVNDKYGHDTGDAVLLCFSKLLTDSLKGLACRWGGEEFVCILTEKDFSHQDLENLCVKFKEYPFVCDGGIFGVTVSVGVSLAENAEDYSIDGLIAEADEALYRAKNSGKDKIEYFK